MTTTQSGARTGVYELMFLASQGSAAQLGSLLEHIDEIFRRAGAEVISMRKWDERRLAYEIDKQKRATYILAYATVPTDQIGHIERDVQISERLMRVLIVKADHLTAEEIASADDRQGLAVEAKLRAERGASEEAETRSGKMRIGAPEPEKAEKADDDEAPEVDTDTDSN